MMARSMDAPVPFATSGCSMATVQAPPIASRRNPAATSSIAGAPSGTASRMASHGPKIAPMVPPTARTPKMRLLCSSVNLSAISAQNTIVLNRLNTLNQT